AIERGGPETFPIPQDELPEEGTYAHVDKRLLMVAEAPFRRGDRLILAAPMKSLSAPLLAETGIAFEPYLATPEGDDDPKKGPDEEPAEGAPARTAPSEDEEPSPEPAPTAAPEPSPTPERRRNVGVTVNTGGGAFRVETDPTGPKTPEAAVEAAANAADAAAKAAGAAPQPKEPFSILRNRWVNWGGRLEDPPLNLDTGKRSEKKRVLLWTRSSLAREFHEFYGRTRLGTGNEGKSDDNIAYRILTVLGTFVGIIYLVAATLAALLVSRIARATGRLSKGFAEIEKGNFSHRASFRGRDQLAELIGSFNRMSAHLAESVTEKAKTEALAHELTLARTLQRRLLPTGFVFPGVEIAVDFRPASVIGGDFYHFVAVGPSDLVVVVADVSGHGLPTGIVMASAKASLSAFLATGAEPSDIFASLDREVRETTDARTFVTMGHSRFRLATGTMELTNAGHLYPYRVTSAGEVSSVANPSRPLGPSLPTKFITVSAPIATGDLWVFLSDGIVEATGTDDTPFGFDRLESVLASCAGMTAAHTKETLLAAWRAHTGSDEPEDDRTLIVVRLEKA
ncbi:MAG: SpoIIE family protein phosphatase, partial [Acidobacteria bacterium]|nr:SpoIIE family protein phosphatase [Acidobacteriota bacterium]